MNRETKNHFGRNPLLAEIKKTSKAKEKNIKCEEYAIKKFQENQNKNK